MATPDGLDTVGSTGILGVEAGHGDRDFEPGPERAVTLAQQHAHGIACFVGRDEIGISVFVEVTKRHLHGLGADR